MSYAYLFIGLALGSFVGYLVGFVHGSDYQQRAQRSMWMKVSKDRPVEEPRSNEAAAGRKLESMPASVRRPSFLSPTTPVGVDGRQADSGIQSGPRSNDL